MEILHLIGFALIIIIVILAMITIELIGFEMYRKEMRQQLNTINDRLNDIEEKTDLSQHSNAMS